MCVPVAEQPEIVLLAEVLDFLCVVQHCVYVMGSDSKDTKHGSVRV